MRRSDRTTFTFSSRMLSAPRSVGGSIATRQSNWSRWFCTMSRNAPGAFVISGARFHPERFRRGDLDMIDVAAIPDRLENRVREPQNQNVLRGLFAEKMIDPVGLTLRRTRR